ncbi:MAG: hypothetical protein IJ410_03450 [Oscillospiraceae bacterium]|nr:hypothetical protein [Oscillospiraceae bacterium]
MIGFINFLSLLVQAVAKLFVNMIGCVLAYIVFMCLVAAVPVIVHKAPYVWEEIKLMEQAEEETWHEN